MVRRRQAVSHRGPGLARTVARAAVISGTATAASGVVANRQRASADPTAGEAHGLADLQQQVEDLQAREVQEDMGPETVGDIGEDLVANLERLGSLHRQGLLTADEFASAKARLLGT